MIGQFDKKDNVLIKYRTSINNALPDLIAESYRFRSYESQVRIQEIRNIKCTSSL